jgi:hypothetical protein
MAWRLLSCRRTWARNSSPQVATGDILLNDPSAGFGGHVLETPWDQLYLTTPFLLVQPGFEHKEIEPGQENGETWRWLQVKFPPSVPRSAAGQ